MPRHKTKLSDKGELARKIVHKHFSENAAIRAARDFINAGMSDSEVWSALYELKLCPEPIRLSIYNAFRDINRNALHQYNGMEYKGKE